MLHHAVLFSFPALDDAKERELYQFIDGWKGRIAAIDHLAFGRNMSDRCGDYGHCLYMQFSDRSRLRAYQTHPLHRDFETWVRAQQGQVLVCNLDESEEPRPEFCSPEVSSMCSGGDLA